jgi:hypothetical protein
LVREINFSSGVATSKIRVRISHGILLSPFYGRAYRAARYNNVALIRYLILAFKTPIIGRCRHCPIHERFNIIFAIEVLLGPIQCAPSEIVPHPRALLCFRLRLRPPVGIIPSACPSFPPIILFLAYQPLVLSFLVGRQQVSLLERCLLRRVSYVNAARDGASLEYPRVTLGEVYNLHTRPERRETDENVNLPIQQTILECTEWNRRRATDEDE